MKLHETLVLFVAPSCYLSSSIIPVSTATRKQLSKSPKETTKLWPPPDDGERCKLEDSFPFNKLPFDVNNETNSNEQSISREFGSSSKSSLVQGFLHKRALPSLFLACALAPLQTPVDFAIIGLISCYIHLWYTRGGLLALPPAGHVPIPVANPMGIRNRLYRRWQRLGVISDILAPLVLVFYLRHDPDVSAFCRPLFVRMAQVVTEECGVLFPLPIRCLVPTIYQLVRVTYLAAGWRKIHARPFETVVFGLGLAYSLTNLLVVLPIVTIRSMRAHFFCVEAEEVTLRTPKNRNEVVFPGF